MPVHTFLLLRCQLVPRLWVAVVVRSFKISVLYFHVVRLPVINPMLVNPWLVFYYLSPLAPSPVVVFEHD